MVHYARCANCQSRRAHPLPPTRLDATLLCVARAASWQPKPESTLWYPGPHIRLVAMFGALFFSSCSWLSPARPAFDRLSINSPTARPLMTTSAGYPLLQSYSASLSLQLALNAARAIQRGFLSLLNGQPRCATESVHYAQPSSNCTAAVSLFSFEAVSSSSGHFASPPTVHVGQSPVPAVVVFSAEVTGYLWHRNLGSGDR